jgi:hypothetical protein
MPIATVHQWQRLGWVHSRKGIVASGRWALWADADALERLRQRRADQRQWPAPRSPQALTTPTRRDLPQQRAGGRGSRVRCAPQRRPDGPQQPIGGAMTSRTTSKLASLPAGPQEATVTKAQDQRRQRAIDRSLAGDPREDICRAWACSKRWRDTWRERSLATEPSWSAERSRSPPTTPTKTPQRIAQLVVALRQTLAQHGKGGGAASIQQALAQQGRVPGPSPRTIYRMLHRSDKEVP